MENITYEGRCMRCKTARQIKNPEVVTMKTGMKAVKGECPICGTKMFRILPKSKQKNEIRLNNSRKW